MARRTMTPARRKRRAIRAAVALPILLAALVLALDFPFLTARGALAATQARYGFGPGEVVTRIKDSRYSTYRYIVRCGDWYASCEVYQQGPLWRSGQLMAVESRPEIPLTSLILQGQFDNSVILVVSNDPEIASVEVQFPVIYEGVAGWELFSVRSSQAVENCFFVTYDETAHTEVSDFPFTQIGHHRLRGYDRGGNLIYESPVPEAWAAYGLEMEEVR